MSVVSRSRTWHCFVAAVVASTFAPVTAQIWAQNVAAPDATAAVHSARSSKQQAAVGAEAIRPFRINVAEEDLVDLRKRVAATRWPDKETVTDQSQGVQQAKLQALLRYWGTGYDWRKAEARLNALPQFVTEIDGLDIQFVHVRSRHPNALPLIMTHGWPGSVLELLKVIGPLTDPTAHGGRAEDAFHLVLPTYPGYGFSGKPQGTNWGPQHVAQAWDVLMRRLGYERYVSQGGDWGAIISEIMAVQAPPGLLGIHINMPGTVPPGVVKLVRTKEPVPTGFSAVEKAAYASLDVFYNKGFGYAEMLNTRPQTVGYALADSPVGMAAFFYDKFATWTYTGGEPERALTRDEMLDDITLYWLTNTGTSSSRSYWDAAQLGGGPFTAIEIRKVPVAVTVFPGEIYRAPRSWAEKSFHNLVYWNEVEKGGHFAAWEEPELFSQELRAAFQINALKDIQVDRGTAVTTALESFVADVLTAHGGLERWRTFDTVTAQVVAGGFLWPMKGMEIGAAPRAIKGEFRRQRVHVEPFGDPDWHMTYTPERIAIETQGGALIAEQQNPRETFAGHTWETAWNPLQLAYFNGYAMWAYYNLPFVLAEPGFEIIEIPPITQDNVTLKGWRVLFPKHVHTHCAEQSVYFDADGLLRRQDYEVDIAGKVRAAHLISEYVDVQGLKLATKRRVFMRNQDGTLQLDQMIVSIDLSDFRLS